MCGRVRAPRTAPDPNRPYDPAERVERPDPGRRPPARPSPIGPDRPRGCPGRPRPGPIGPVVGQRVWSPAETGSDGSPIRRAARSPARPARPGVPFARTPPGPRPYASPPGPDPRRPARTDLGPGWTPGPHRAPSASRAAERGRINLPHSDPPGHGKPTHHECDSSARPSPHGHSRPTGSMTSPAPPIPDRHPHLAGRRRAEPDRHHAPAANLPSPAPWNAEEISRARIGCPGSPSPPASY